MDIALVILHADPARGGAERYTVDLAAALRDRGHRVSLIATNFDAHRHSDDVHLPVSGPTRAGKYSRFIEKLNKHLHETKYDIVHAMLPVPHCDIYHPHAGIAADAVQSGHLKHASIIKQSLSKLATHLNARRMKFAAIERELLTSKSPPVVLCLSDHIKGVVRKHFDLPEQKLATLFNAVDLKKFDPAARPDAARELKHRLAIPDDRVVALMIAQDFARKGLREAIEALAKVIDDRLILLVVGKQDPAHYRDLAQSLGVQDRVTFAGPTTDPFSFYRAADFFVLPTRHDPCSLVVLEALAMGLPVISTVFNGACEIMQNGREGFVLDDPADIPTLAGAMEKLADKEFRAAMSRACLELRPALAYEKHLDRLLSIYSSAKVK